MFRYHYFIRKIQVPYTFMKKIQCIRVPEGDTRIPKLTEKFKQIGWFISYSYKPTKEEEIFKLKLQFQEWNDMVEIQSIDDAEKMKTLS